MLAAAAAGVALFVVHTSHHRNPLIDRRLFALRAFTGASTVALVFSAAFGAMLLSRELWAQDVWGWSALRTGLAIAPGPLMVPLFATLGGRLVPRLGAGPIIAAGCATFAAGAAWWAFAAGVHPDYVGEMLGGMLVTGVGTGLALPTLIATGSASARRRGPRTRRDEDLRDLALATATPRRAHRAHRPRRHAAAQAARDVSIVVNNTGIALGTPVLEAPIDRIREELETNLFGTIRVTRACAPVLATQPRSALVNVLSVLSWLSMGTGYDVSKAAAWSATN